jgi:MtrB/PioB family decaheme-associated outer membrane protein
MRLTSRIPRPLVPLIGLATVLMWSAPAKLAGEEKPVPAKPSSIPAPAKVTIEVGGEFSDTSSEDDHSSKFEEHRDIPKGVILRSFELQLEDANRPFRFDLRGTDLTQRDQKATAGFDWFGRAKMRFVWDQLPNFGARGVQSVLNEVGPNLYVVPDPTQQTLEATANADIGPIVGNLILSTPRTDLRLQRNTGTFLGTFTPTANWELRFNVERQIHSGLRRISTGTYDRIGTATGDTFRTPGQEIGERLDRATTIFDMGASYRQPKWSLNFDYTLSLFHNNQLGLQWENPFRFTDAQALPPGGVLGRGQFAAGQLALAPDSQAHQITLSGFVLLPLRSKFSGLFSIGFWRQDEPFLPFTLNTAITAANLASGVTPTSLDALPARSLQGDVRTITNDYVFTSRPFSSITTTVRYRNYDYSNRTPELEFPGYAAFGESFWRTAIGTEPIESFPMGFFKQKGSAEVGWRPGKAFRFQGDYYWEGWNRRFREVRRTNEHAVGGRMTLEPNKWFFLRTGYHYGDRTPLDYSVRYEEFNLGRMFDQSRRIRHDFDGMLQLQPSDRLSASVNYQYFSDNYDVNFYGLHNYMQGQFGADLNYALPKTGNVYLSYSFDRIRTDYASVAKAGGTPAFRVANTWLRDTRDAVHSVMLGFYYPTLEDRVTYDVSYGFALSKNFIATSNPFTFEPGVANSAQAYPWPEITDRFQELRLASDIKLRENLTLVLSYMFQPYRLDDFMWDIMDPWIADSIAPENFAQRFLFLNARDSDYRGHVASVTLRYSF